MKLLRFFIFVILAVSLLPSSIAAEWQWSVQISGIVSNAPTPLMQVRFLSVAFYSHHFFYFDNRTETRKSNRIDKKVVIED